MNGINDNLIEHIGKILLKLQLDRPWLTANALSRKLNSHYNINVTSGMIETALEIYSNEPGRKIRHSFYPSRQSLENLWGHVDIVGEQKFLPGLRRVDPSLGNNDFFKGYNLSFFISYSHLDADSIMELCIQLNKSGFGAWTFENEIPEYGHISDAVRQAMRSCNYLISYVSARSLGSLWVQKELGAAMHAKRTFIFLDGEDLNLLNLFENWPCDNDLYNTFCIDAATNIGKTNDGQWCNRCRYFMSQLHEYLDTTKSLTAFPSPNDKVKWMREDLTLETFSEFLVKMRTQFDPELPL